MDVLAARLERYPNLAVDISARVPDLARQEAATVRRFFQTHQDRILLGTDVVMRRSLSQLEDDERREALAALRERFETYFAYLEARGMVNVGGRETQGLNLPTAVLEKVCRTNALAWYPGIEGSQ